MYTFRMATEEAQRLRHRILRTLERRHAISIGELSMRLGAVESVVREEVEAMVAHGEVERLRPVDYTRDDLDFFCASRPAARSNDSGGRLESQGAQNGRMHVRPAGETMACLAD